MAHAQFTMGYLRLQTHTFGICNNDCFSTATTFALNASQCYRYTYIAWLLSDDEWFLGLPPEARASQIRISRLDHSFKTDLPFIRHKNSVRMLHVSTYIITAIQPTRNTSSSVVVACLSSARRPRCVLCLKTSIEKDFKCKHAHSSRRSRHGSPTCRYSTGTFSESPYSMEHSPFLKKLTGFKQVKKFPAFYGNRRFITAFTSARQLSLS